MPFSHQTRVGVLRGGPSSEYEVSLNTGKALLSNLPEGYEPVDILISRDGLWHERGLTKSPESILNRVDVVLNGLHGTYGEDGQVQRILDTLKVPYVGSRAIPSAIAMHKAQAKKIYRNSGLKTPHSIYIPFHDLSRSAIHHAFQNTLAPFVVKPVSGGSSVGVYIVSSLPELEEAVIAASGVGDGGVLIEEFISGKEATLGVIDGFRGTQHYPLLPIEIRHNKNFFDYDAKYSVGGAEEICPGNFSQSESETLQKMAIIAHQALGLSHYSRSDFLIHPRRGIYILETNSLPGLTETSLIPKALKAVGSSIKEFIAHLLHQVKPRKNSF